MYPKYILPSLILNSDFLLTGQNRPTFSRPSSKIESLSCTTAIFLVTWSVDFRIKYFGKEDFSHPLSVPLARSLQLANLEKCEKWISQEKCNGILRFLQYLHSDLEARHGIIVMPKGSWQLSRWSSIDEPLPELPQVDFSGLQRTRQHHQVFRRPQPSPGKL